MGSTSIPRRAGRGPYAAELRHATAPHRCYVCADPRRGAGLMMSTPNWAMFICVGCATYQGFTKTMVFIPADTPPSPHDAKAEQHDAADDLDLLPLND